MGEALAGLPLLVGITLIVKALWGILRAML
jgi:hypothetical protein